MNAEGTPAAIGISTLRHAIAALPADVSHDATGDRSPTVNEVFAPEQHAAALDPKAPIVIGARGTGKSFWAGVLGKTETRQIAATAYPRLGLDRLWAGYGFTGLPGEGAVSPEMVDSAIPPDADLGTAKLFWTAVILRTLGRICDPNGSPEKIARLMSDCRDPEDREERLQRFDQTVGRSDRLALVIFDAVDTLATRWDRRRLLTDALLQVIWSLRAWRNIRAKLFIRPDQIDDEQLRFVELPKLRAGAIELQWQITDLYGLLFARLAMATEAPVREELRDLLASLGLTVPPAELILNRRWPLARDREMQSAAFALLAGPYMGANAKRGRTYDWPFRHLADGLGQVTPRSFLKLMVDAAKHEPAPPTRVLSADGIRHGLRGASRLRVDQLHVEFPWIRRALVPLDGVLVPAEVDAVLQRWRETATVPAIFRHATEFNYLPPFAADLPNAVPANDFRNEQRLLEAMTRIGVLATRADGRIDMPDLFRVAAQLLRKGGVAPRAKPS